jgi:hypothetical protein
MFSPPIPQVPSTAVAQIPTGDSALEFMDGELVVVKKYLKIFNDEDDKGKRLALLKEKILPPIFLFHKENNDWPHRKAVSTDLIYNCFCIDHYD